MHILHVIDSLAIGGAERMLVDIANASVADGHQIGVCITRASRADLARELDSAVDLHVLNRTRRFDWGSLRDFSNLIQQCQYQVIHVHGRSSLSFCASAKTLYHNEIPVVFHDHYGRIETDERVPHWFRLWARHYVTKYIGVYEKLRAWALTVGIRPGDIAVIGNGINLERFTASPAVSLRQEFGIESSALVGIIVAGLRPEKGIDLLIDSLSQCTNLNIRVLVVGGTSDRDYVQQCKLLAKQKGVSDYLIFTGERSDVASLNRAVDFALVPSRSESGPLVLIEYLASGLPVVAFRVGDVAQVAAQQAMQGIVEPNDTSAFGKALTALVSSSPSDRLARGRRGQEIARQHFSIESKMPAFYEVYRQALEAQ